MMHCGYAHHFVGAESCRYHLATFVRGGRWLISTVGDYRPDGRDKPMVSLGWGDEANYETMVFPCDPDQLTDGEPTVTDWSAVDQERYGTADKANEGHARICRRYSRIDAVVPT